jgi:hypothetical protein
LAPVEPDEELDAPELPAKPLSVDAPTDASLDPLLDASGAPGPTPGVEAEPAPLAEFALLPVPSDQLLFAPPAGPEQPSETTATIAHNTLGPSPRWRALNDRLVRRISRP